MGTPSSPVANLRRRFPRVYGVIRRGYDLLASLAGTRLLETRWARRRPEEVRSGLNNLHHPQRRLIVEHIGTLGAFAGLLEVGSGYGPNLYHLARRFPHAVLRGIDINPASVAMGTEWLRSVGLPQVQLRVGRADDLRAFADQSFDLVLTNSLLMYIGPDKIERTIREMLRVARRYLILVEHHWSDDDSLGSGRFRDGRWMRNYVLLLERFVRTPEIEVRKIPPDLWEDAAWQQWGHIITCRGVPP